MSHAGHTAGATTWAMRRAETACTDDGGRRREGARRRDEERETAQRRELRAVEQREERERQREVAQARERRRRQRVQQRDELGEQQVDGDVAPVEPQGVDRVIVRAVHQVRESRGAEANGDGLCGALGAHRGNQEAHVGGELVWIFVRLVVHVVRGSRSA